LLLLCVGVVCLWFFLNGENENHTNDAVENIIGEELDEPDNMVGVGKEVPDPAESGTVAEEETRDIVSKYPLVEMSTNKGMIRLELYPNEAPKTVENFLQYVRDEFYQGTIFHRVVPGFVIQGGGFNSNMQEKNTRAPIENEANNGLRNLRGAICMARTPDPHSATSQFFINTKDNPALDFRDATPRGFGYAVFGTIVEGMDIVDAIEKVKTSRTGSYDDVPVEPVIIETVQVILP